MIFWWFLISLLVFCLFSIMSFFFPPLQFQQRCEQMEAEISHLKQENGILRDAVSTSTNQMESKYVSSYLELCIFLSFPWRTLASAPFISISLAVFAFVFKPGSSHFGAWRYLFVFALSQGCQSWLVSFISWKPGLLEVWDLTGRTAGVLSHNQCIW